MDNLSILFLLSSLPARKKGNQHKKGDKILCAFGFKILKGFSTQCEGGPQKRNFFGEKAKQRSMRGFSERKTEGYIARFAAHRTVFFSKVVARFTRQLLNFVSHSFRRAKKKNQHTPKGMLVFGAPEGIRTPDLLVRSQTLYPAELLAQGTSFGCHSIIAHLNQKIKYYF